ncbi:MAG: DUF3014 domain-containing protein [Victivallales bacterium]|nr:DUF3014 domain-containing protein [Victivallales bacterium]MBR5026408.1 DUF3014 domain-containing protein [Victivallales bacterium]
MKSKFFIYVLPLILGVVATILMLNAPQPQKGAVNKPVAVSSPADVPVVPSEKTDEQPTTNEEEKKDGETEPAEKQEETEEAEEEEETEKPVELDKLREAFIAHAKSISQNELWLEFIAREDALVRCVKAVDSIAAGDIPVEPLDFLKPKTPFSASLNALGLLVVTMESIMRYKTAMDALHSIDMQAAADLYNEIEPVLNAIFHELGYPETVTFRSKLTEACTVILETPVMKGEGGLVHIAANLYKYSNPQLEELRPVQKLLMRLGEKNREEIRRRVTEFSKLLKLYAE